LTANVCGVKIFLNICLFIVKTNQNRRKKGKTRMLEIEKLEILTESAKYKNKKNHKI